uniref:Uncharacterized protein n=1 Tax=Lygus hesperus TaxID=30085 RepID=A0A146LTM0_LYGHE
MNNRLKSCDVFQEILRHQYEFFQNNLLQYHQTGSSCWDTWTQLLFLFTQSTVPQHYRIRVLREVFNTVPKAACVLVANSKTRILDITAYTGFGVAELKILQHLAEQSVLFNALLQKLDMRTSRR